MCVPDIPLLAQIGEKESLNWRVESRKVDNFINNQSYYFKYTKLLAWFVRVYSLTTILISKIYLTSLDIKEECISVHLFRHTNLHKISHLFRNIPRLLRNTTFFVTPAALFYWFIVYFESKQSTVVNWTTP